MDLSGRRCRGGALPPALAGQAAGSRAPGRAGRRYLCLGGSDRRAPDRRAGPRRAVRRLVTILRREAAAGYPQRYCTLRMPVARPGWRYRRPGKSRVTSV